MTDIIVQGLTQNNLKHITFTIPKEKITVFTGVSGSGKSSIVFDTIAAESQRQMNATYPAFVRSRLPKGFFISSRLLVLETVCRLWPV